MTPATAPVAKPVISSEADLLDLAPVVPVVVVDSVEQAVPLARALLAGGIPVIELTLRSAAGLGAIEAVASEVEGMVVGAGTVVTPEQVRQVQDAGAQFIVTPGSPPRLLEAALASGLPLLAGAGTLTEMLTLAEAGLEAMKFFPAEASGGRPYLSAVSGPCPQLRFCPTGGITRETAADWLALPNVGCTEPSGWCHAADRGVASEG
ncbi:bifunctional 4-hydroxy-2-oxoglutarate aldolase/2-dehydro-3-deoxy-phosphogluconate aldolase [Pedococcus sp. 2YAF34]|uniref:bifunctional 4-hydroxy-2-oxoglutarate aldolase/2-dehydro-3-deoxy-phosphogluconate aldolase n=1 Tax=Pedococcus sp. 2YAF34 TaxID=3233032 RepID=UPI003F986005